MQRDKYVCRCLWGMLLFATIGCGVSKSINIPGLSPAVKGNGTVVTATRDVTSYSKLHVGSVAELQWRPGESATLEVSVEENLAPLLITEVEGETLKIYFKENVQLTKPLVIKTSSAKLDAFRGEGASKSELHDVQAESFQLDLSGTARCIPQGKVERLRVECSGASKCQAGDLAAHSAKVQSSGSAAVKINTTELTEVSASGASQIAADAVNSPSLSVELSGSSKCELSGSVQQLQVVSSGASSFKAPKLTVSAADVSLSGTASVRLGGVQRITGGASGASRVEYDGQAKASVSTSGVAKVVSHDP